MIMLKYQFYHQLILYIEFLILKLLMPFNFFLFFYIIYNFIKINYKVTILIYKREIYQ